MCSVQYRLISSEGKPLLSAITVNIFVALLRERKGLMLGFTYVSSTFSDWVLNVVLIFVLNIQYGQPDPIYHNGNW